VEIRGLRLDARTQDVSVPGSAVELSTLEFKLLHFLASRAAADLQRERLLDEVWAARLLGHAAHGGRSYPPPAREDRGPPRGTGVYWYGARRRVRMLADAPGGCLSRGL